MSMTIYFIDCKVKCLCLNTVIFLCVNSIHCDVLANLRMQWTGRGMADITFGAW